MGKQVRLLRSIAPQRRDFDCRRRSRTPEAVFAAKRFSMLYFDGPRAYGYGGYENDGRWLRVAGDLIDHFDLDVGHKVLDIGCAKGFLVDDLRRFHLDAWGLDISRYALCCAPEKVKPKLLEGSADALPFPDNSFDCVVSINTLHNLPRDRILVALREIMRVAREPIRAFVQVDGYTNDKQRKALEDWVLTAEYYGTPHDWLALFAEAGYVGDYDWTLMEGSAR
jgi:SAM-dependent methyltransferase